MSEQNEPTKVTLDTVSAQINELRDLFARRLFEDKNTKALVQRVNDSLARRDTIDTRKAFSPFVSELLLALDRLRANEPSAELNQSVVDETETVLSRYGVSRIDNDGAVDPKVHEIVGVEPATDGAESNTIVEVVRPGYMLGDTVLRPSQVVVTK